MEDALFDDPQGTIQALVTSPDHDAGELSKYLRTQIDCFTTGKLGIIKTNEAYKDGGHEILRTKKFTMEGCIVELSDDIINTAMLITNEENIDLALVCRALVKVVEAMRMQEIQTRQKLDAMCSDLPLIGDCFFLLVFQFMASRTEVFTLLVEVMDELETLIERLAAGMGGATKNKELVALSNALTMAFYSMTEDPSATLIKPIGGQQQRPDVNQLLADGTFAKTLGQSIGAIKNVTLARALSMQFNLLLAKTKPDTPSAHLAKAFAADAIPGTSRLSDIITPRSYEHLLLKRHFNFVLENFICSFIIHFPTNEAKSAHVALLAGALDLARLLRQRGNADTRRLYACATERGFLRYLWMQIPFELVTPAFETMGALAACNGIEVFNFFTKESPNFPWPKIFQTATKYAMDFANPEFKLELVPQGDLHALVAFIHLIAGVVGHSSHLAQMLSQFDNIVTFAFRFIPARTPFTVRIAAVKLITAAAKYPNYVQEIWQKLVESRIFPGALKEETSYKTSTYRFSQHLLEMFYELIQASPFLFDPHNGRTLAGYLEFLIDLFGSFNNMSFTNTADKWRFSRVLLDIFIYCLGQFKTSIINSAIDTRHPVYPLYHQLVRDSTNETMKTILNIIHHAHINHVDLMLNFTVEEDYLETLSRCIDMLLFVSDTTTFAPNDAKALAINVMGYSHDAIKDIAMLVGHERKELSMKALQLIAAFETHTRRLAAVFLGSKDNEPEMLLSRFVDVLDAPPPMIEDFQGNQSYQAAQFDVYTAASPQWVLVQMILSGLEASSSTYSLAHFLLGCPSPYDLSTDFEIASRTCLSVALEKMASRTFAARHPHLIEALHEIVARLSAGDTAAPAVAYLGQADYFSSSLAVLREATSTPRERAKAAHISSLGWVLRTMAVASHTSHDHELNELFITLVGGGRPSDISEAPLQVLALFNAIEFAVHPEGAELARPKAFEQVPSLEASCVTAGRHSQLINLPALHAALEKDPRYSASAEDIDREVESCARLNTHISLLAAKARALDAWKLFVNDTLLQSDVIASINENVPISLIQRLVGEFANERHPVNSGISLGYTIISLLHILKIKKDSNPLEADDGIIETKIKGIFEGLLQAVARSPYQPIRGIAYIAIVKYLELTQVTAANPAKPMAKHNLILLAKVEDRFIRILATDCASFAAGWKMAALTCLETLLGVDEHRGARTLGFIEDRGLVASIVAECASVLGSSWESTDTRALRVYECQMSVLLKISQQQDGIRVLINNSLIGHLSTCVVFSAVPGSIDHGVLPALLLPVLRLLASMLLMAHERTDVFAQVSSFITSHTDLFKLILQDNNAPSMTTLALIQPTVYIFAQLARLPKSNQQFIKFHYSLLALLSLYSSRDLSIPPVDPEHVEMSQKQDYGNFKERASLFTIDVRHRVTMVCRDLIIYCRRVSILPDCKFGSVCFSPNLTSNSDKTIIPSLDMPIRYLYACLDQHTQAVEVIANLTLTLDNVDHLSNLQYKSRTVMAQKMLNEMLEKRYLLRDSLIESIECLLLLIVSHAYYYTRYSSSLATDQLSLSTSSPPTTTQALEMSDLSASTPKKSNNNNIFRETQATPGTTQRLMSSVYSYFKPSSSTTPSIGNNQQHQQQQSFSQQYTSTRVV
eukprot:gene2894-3324_t